MLQALLYQATWRESSSNLAAFADLPREGLGGLWERRVCFHSIGWTFWKKTPGFPRVLPLITKLTHAISDPETESSPICAPLCWCGRLYWQCFLLFFLGIHVLALRLLSDIFFFVLEKLFFEPLVSEKCLDFSVKMHLRNFITHISLNLSLSFFLSPHR